MSIILTILMMIHGILIMGGGVLAIWSAPDLGAMLPIWFCVGLGWSLVQTPAGRLVNRSSSPGDRSAYFSAQFALSHAAWLLAYPIAGQLGARLGIETTALWMGGAILLFAGLSAIIWPAEETVMLDHQHDEEDHQHLHTHGPHHQHPHKGDEGPEPHAHDHHHHGISHAHTFVIDDHHMRWPKPNSA